MPELHNASISAPIVKVVTVPASPERAFERFTKDMTSWWPLRSHSVGEAEAETVVMEPRLGGRIVERIRGGRDAVWGTVTAWDPPHRVAFTWHPGDGSDEATQVDVRFTAEAERTRVELQHSGFERLGPNASRMRRAYPIGWSYVLGLYASRRGPFMILMKGLTSTLMAVRRVRMRRATAA